MSIATGVRRSELRDSLGLLSRGLVAYGVLGIAIGLIGLVVGLGLWSQIGSVRADLGAARSALESSAQALADASASARTMGTSLEETAPALDRAATSVGTLAPTLRALASETSAIEILGARPLATAATLFGQTADELDALKPSMTTAATNLRTSSGSMGTFATSLDQLSVNLRSIETQLGDSGVAASLERAVTYVFVAVLALAIWMLVPALAALAFGWWLRRRLAASSVPPSATAP